MKRCSSQRLRYLGWGGLGCVGRNFLETLLVVACMVAGPLRGAEYFVSVQGDDAASGLSKAEAFRSVQRGLDALLSGDTLTIGPGEYFGSAVRKDLGSLEHETLIRAEIPGTAVMRGDVPAPIFEAHPEHARVFVADFDDDVQGVNEVDTLSLIKEAASVADVAFMPGSFFQDKEAGKLYLSTSDFRPADRHTYSISVNGGQHGLLLENAKRVTVDGLGFRGFKNRLPLRDHRPQWNVWGLYLPFAKNCIVRNSTAWLNSGGILINSAGGGDNIIESCIGYGNGTTHNSEIGNICIFSPNNDTIRNCVGYRSAGTGVRMYGVASGTCVIESSLGWGNSLDLGMKGAGLEKNGRNRNSIALGNMPGYSFEHCLIGNRMVYLPDDELPKDSVQLGREGIVLKKEFADPVNFDFRLQSNSRLRGAASDGSDRGPFAYEANVFYVRPGGADEADGLSVSSAWKTAQRAVRDLKPGDTVYFEEGDYGGPVEVRAGTKAGQPISLRGRGTGQITFSGPVMVQDSQGVEFRRLAFSEVVRVKESSGTTFDNCLFGGVETGLEVEGGAQLAIRHSEFVRAAEAAVSLVDVEGVTLESNLFANTQGVAVASVKPDSGGVLESLRSLFAPDSKVSSPASPVVYSDYNSYANPERAWSIYGDSLSLKELRPEHDAHSMVQIPDYEETGGNWQLQNHWLFAGHGARGKSVGRHQDLADGESILMTEPKVHSVSATTANIEWLVSKPRFEFEVAWGETPECENTATFATHTVGSLHNTFSLTGLKPATQYFFRVKSIQPLPYGGLPLLDAKVVDPHYEMITFTTLADDPPPRIFFVAPDGSDSNSGLDRKQAWQTVAHAATTAGPGDTVMVAAGTYIERVRIRNTGDEGRPITFRNIPGEKVVFDGDKQRLNNAWVISGKHHIVVDGFYFHHHYGEPVGSVSQRLFDVVESSNITIRRCMLDGSRSAGYPASLLTALNTKDLTLSNVVSILAPDGVEVTNSPGFRIENSVFVCTMIHNVKLNTPATLASNIFCDSGEFKAKDKVQLQLYAGPVKDRNNCYFFRYPDEERTAFIIKWPDRISLAALKQTDPEIDSIIANPEFALMKRLPPGKTIPPFPVDLFYEKGLDLDFPDFFATNPEVVSRGIGLQPEAFEDFQFPDSPTAAQ